MRRPRLFLPQPLGAGAEITVEGERAHYLRSVLRLRAGAPLTVFNGEGGEFGAEVLTVDRRRVRLRIGAWCDREAESPLPIHLGLAIAKGERMDWAVQKAVELGVTAITPLATERCNVILKGDKAGRKRQHWQAIVIAACEQCGRNRVPPVHPPQALSAWLAAQSHGMVLDPGGRPLSALTSPPPRTALLVGPEGGLSGTEIEQACEAGFVQVSLGPRILRVETAVAAALAAFQVLWGDANG